MKFWELIKRSFHQTALVRCPDKPGPDNIELLCFISPQVLTKGQH